MDDTPVIWVNEKDEVFGDVPFRKAHDEGLLHRVAVVYLINERGEMRVQKKVDNGS